MTDNPTVTLFLDTLKTKNIDAEISSSKAEKIISATDNSIYEVVPEAIIYPKNESAIKETLTLLNNKKFHDLSITAKGGATGCNGQSLNSSIILDLSRFMHHIGKLNIEEEWVDVDPGVTLAELNNYLSPYNYHFAPNVSPADRATIGGMFSTDASGKGSLRYGKTSQHILSCDIVLANGEKHTLSSIPINQLQTQPTLHQSLYNIAINKQAIIQKVFKDTTRFLSGYNLKHILNKEKNTLSLIPLFSGSEGTLGIVTKLRCKLTKLPQNTSLIILSHPSFDAALNCITTLKKQRPIAIEIIDEQVLEHSQENPLISQLSNTKKEATKAITYIEIDQESIKTPLHTLTKSLKAQIIRSIHITEKNDIKKYWQLRKESVGAISKVINNTQAIPFMEDHAVDPKHLVEYINDIKDLFKKQKVTAAMYGHADVGCIHMRPRLNLNNEEDRQKLNHLQREAIKIVQKYHGIVWAEHGKGFRHEALPDIFGPCYPLLKQIKTLLDPHNKLNPGKIVAPEGYSLNTFNSLGPLRYNQTSTLSKHDHNHFQNIFHCNGNGLCHSSSLTQNMCPSYKYSRHKLHSPKGRAMLLKHWLQNIKHTSKTNIYKHKQLLQDIKASLTNCLSCKACSETCPVAIDIPRYKSHYLNWYYQYFKRPLRDKLLRQFERSIPLQITLRYVLSTLLKNSIIKTWIKHLLKLENLPIPSTSQLKIPKKKSSTNKEKVFIIQDPFTRLYTPKYIETLFILCEKLNKNPQLIRYFEIGKTQEILGHPQTFKKIAQKNKTMLDSLHQKGAILCIEPSIFYCFHDEYRYANAALKKPLISLQRFLLNNHKDLPKLSPKNLNITWQFFAHCMEQSHPKDIQDWLTLFKQLNIQTNYLPLGCCGQAGLYGYQSQNQNASNDIFQKGWNRQVKTNILVTGFSCAHKLTLHAHTPKHPLELFMATH
ncbi:MAG: FAD-binding and (Fe-S)-binding domain-containing protein [bacterium]